MKALFDQISYECSKNITRTYSTSFSAAVNLLSPSIRQDIYNIYGFVRLADEIVDSFHEYDKEKLFSIFKSDLEQAFEHKISLNPVLNAFQYTCAKYKISRELVDSFMKSMELDLTKKQYESNSEIEQYIYGSADVVGLMCLTVFVKGDQTKYEALKGNAMKLGSAFQKVNFLRDMKADFELLERNYFPGTDLSRLDETSKQRIIDDIEADFAAGYKGIIDLPMEAKFGVYTAYIYYKKLLSKLKKTPSVELKNRRIRVPAYQKYGLYARCYFNYKLNIL